MVVLKFGGSSVATSAAMSRVVEIVARERRPSIVVVSALGGATDQLLDAASRSGRGDEAGAVGVIDDLRVRHMSMADALVDVRRREALVACLEQVWTEVTEMVRACAAARHCPPAARDAIVASGEVASSRLVAGLLREGGVPAAWVDARRVVVTDGRHEQAAPNEAATRDRARTLLRPLVERGDVPVLGGFIGATLDGVATTLGRGGSDYSASLIGACLDASEVQIWTDTDGVLTADPRVLPQARTVARLSYGEAAALAHFGAKVLHPATVAPAIGTGIPVRVLNAQRPASSGTLITGRPVQRTRALAGIAWRTGVSLLTLDLAPAASRAEALARVTGACHEAGVSVHQSSVSDSGIALVIDSAVTSDTVLDAAASLGHARRRDGLAILAAVGDSLSQNPELCAAVLRRVGRVPLHLLAQAPGACHLTVLLAERRLDDVLARVHERFFERDQPHLGVDHIEESEPWPGDGPVAGAREVWA